MDLGSFCSAVDSSGYTRTSADSSCNVRTYPFRRDIFAPPSAHRRRQASAPGSGKRLGRMMAREQVEAPLLQAAKSIEARFSLEIAKSAQKKKGELPQIGLTKNNEGVLVSLKKRSRRRTAQEGGEIPRGATKENSFGPLICPTGRPRSIVSPTPRRWGINGGEC